MQLFVFVQTLLLLCGVRLSTQSPQSSFFGWGSSATESANTETPIQPTFPSVIKTQDLPAQPIVRMENQVPVALPTQQTQTLPFNLSTSSQPEHNNVSTPIQSSNSTLNDTTLPKKENSTAPLINLLGNEITSYVTTSVVFLGAALGREGCDLKAACLVGKMVPEIQGRDIALVAAEPLVPEGLRLFYQAVKSSMLQGQDCSQYNCV